MCKQIKIIGDFLFLKLNGNNATKYDIYIYSSDFEWNDHEN